MSWKVAAVVAAGALALSAGGPTSAASNDDLEDILATKRIHRLASRIETVEIRLEYVEGINEVQKDQIELLKARIGVLEGQLSRH